MNEAEIRELLTIHAEAEILHQFSETLQHTSKCHVSLRVTGFEWTHAQIPENHWRCEWTKIKPSRDKPRDIVSVYFPELKEALLYYLK